MSEFLCPSCFYSTKTGSTCFWVATNESRIPPWIDPGVHAHVFKVGQCGAYIKHIRHAPIDETVIECIFPSLESELGYFDEETQRWHRRNDGTMFPSSPIGFRNYKVLTT